MNAETKRMHNLKKKLKHKAAIRNRLRVGSFVYTDYPFRELGDVPNQIAPIRKVIFISWDGDKYCVVKYKQFTLELKAWYLHRSKNLSSAIRHWDLPIVL
jgi:hypothetical protein